MSAASSASAKTKPFLFDRSFDDPSKVYLPGEKFGPKVKVDLPKPKAKSGEAASDAESESKPAEPPPPPPKTFSEAELEAAREEGYVEGHTSALEEAETAREHYVADALNIISKSLDGLEDQQGEANREIGETALRLVYAVIEKVVPMHAQAHAIESVEALVREVLPLVYDEPTLVVRTHNMIADDVQARIEEVCSRSNFSGSISVTPDYELQPGDCRVDWKGGGADRNEARLWNDIRTIIAENLGAVDVDALDAAADAEAPPPPKTADPAHEEVIESDSDTAHDELQPDASMETGAEPDVTTELQGTDETEQEEPVQPALDDPVQPDLENDGLNQEDDAESLES